MSEGLPGTPLFVSGRSRDLDGDAGAGGGARPVAGRQRGAYEAQLPDVDEARLRAKYTTREDGSYCVRTSPRRATRSRWTARSAS